MTFKVGDKVRAYSGSLSYLYTVSSIETHGMLSFKETSYWFHRKQCRKLVKKERRRVWVGWDYRNVLNQAMRVTAHKPADNWACSDEVVIEFVEVKKK